MVTVSSNSNGNMDGSALCLLVINILKDPTSSQLESCLINLPMFISCSLPLITNCITIVLRNTEAFAIINSYDVG